MDAKPRIIISGGGTGGHIFPAISIAHAIKSLNPDAEMKDRMIYELMPLIKEYLAEGYLLKAKDSFCDLFLKETGRLMYE